MSSFLLLFLFVTQIMKASINPSVPRGCCHHESARARVDSNAAEDNLSADANAATDRVRATAASTDGSTATLMNVNAAAKPKRSRSKAYLKRSKMTKSYLQFPPSDATKKETAEHRSRKRQLETLRKTEIDQNKEAAESIPHLVSSLSLTHFPFLFHFKCKLYIH